MTLNQELHNLRQERHTLLKKQSSSVRSSRKSIETPLVSIIVLNFNGERIISDCLENILNLDYPNFEVVVIDNNSSDNSCDIIGNICRVEEKKSNIITLKQYIHSSHKIYFDNLPRHLVESTCKAIWPESFISRHGPDGVPNFFLINNQV